MEDSQEKMRSPHWHQKGARAVDSADHHLIRSLAMPTPASHIQLDALAEASADVSRRFAALDARVTEERWHRRPAKGEWSVAECIAHLNLTSAAMLPRLRAAFDEARQLPPLGDRPYRGAAFGRMLAAMVGPVPRLLGLRLGRTKTVAAFVPGSDLPRTSVVNEFRRWQGEWLALIWRAEGLPLDRVRVESPFVSGARYDAYSALWIVLRHELRHIAQAEHALDRLR